MHEVVVVGAGLCGIWAAKLLAEAGVRVLLLDAGPSLSPEALVPPGADKSLWEAAAVRQPVQSRHPSYWTHAPRLFVDDVEHPYGTGESKPFVWIRGRQVGGRGLTWGGVTLRFSGYELDEWPMTYADLAPFFDTAETFFGVSGMRDGLAQLPDGEFLPPPSLTDAETRFKRAVESRWKHRAVVHCRGIDSPQRSPLFQALPDALGTGNVTVQPDTIVSHLLTDRSGRRVTGVSCVDRRTKSSFELRARATILCASTIESVRILLNSRSREHPAGVGGSSGCLGRYLLDHAATAVVGDIPGEPYQGGFAFGGRHGIVIPRFRNIGEPVTQFTRGYGVWGNLGRGQWHSGNSMWTLCAMIEVLPNRDNVVQLDERRADAWGIPVPVITLAHGPNELQMLEDAEGCMQEMVDTVGWRVHRAVRMQPGGFVHELGGARMGKSSRDSVLDPFNRCWDVRNLFVLDGSSFVSAGWQNPSLTMLALVARACPRIAADIRSGDL